MPPADSLHKGSSPLRVCLKFLEEGHDPATALEFVSEWGSAETKRRFQEYVKALQQGRPLAVILEDIAVAYPSPESELLIAAIEARLQTGNFPVRALDIVRTAEELERQVRADMELVIGPGRRWTLGLVWSGILGGAMLIIALPLYSQAFLGSRAGRVVFGVAIALEIVGLLWAGMLLRLQSRIDRELTRP